MADEQELKLSKEFSETLIVRQLERAERHEKRTERMFWGIVGLFLMFMTYAYILPTSVEQTATGDNIQKVENKVN